MSALSPEKSKVLCTKFLSARPTSCSSTFICQSSPLDPDSAVAIDGKREARSFRNEVDGFVPLSRDRSAVLRRAIELHRNDLIKDKTMLKLQSRTPSLLHDCTSLPRGFCLTAESGFSPTAKSGFPVAEAGTRNSKRPRSSFFKRLPRRGILPRRPALAALQSFLQSVHFRAERAPIAFAQRLNGLAVVSEGLCVGARRRQFLCARSRSG